MTSKGPQPTCQRCGVEMPRRQFASGKREAWGKWRKRKHCSLMCRRGAIYPAKPPVHADCLWCGAANPTANTRYCSLQCRNASYVRLPASDLAGRWQAQRIYELDYCRRCGSTQDLHRHHRNHNAKDNRPENVEIVCQPCHAAHHRNFRKNSAAPLGQGTVA